MSLSEGHYAFLRPYNIGKMGILDSALKGLTVRETPWRCVYSGRWKRCGCEFVNGECVIMVSTQRTKRKRA